MYIYQHISVHLIFKVNGGNLMEVMCQLCKIWIFVS